jgi:3-hydroxyacyl-[acyl-carrier-protein] dehydratase
MRWIWIDRFVEFESGKRAAAVKRLPHSAEYFHDHVPDCPFMPAGLLIEGMAQTAGILVGEARGFAENVILAKIRTAEFTDLAGPGDELRYETQIEAIDDRAAITGGRVIKNGTVIGRVDLIFSHVNQSDRAGELPGHNFVFTDRFRELLSAFRDSGGEGERATQ